QIEFTTAGTFSWTVPDGVYEVSAVAVGGGGGGSSAGFARGTGGGGGGGLVWANKVPVVPGQVLTIGVGMGGFVETAVGVGGTPGGDSFIQFGSGITFIANGGGGGVSYSGSSSTSPGTRGSG